MFAFYFKARCVTLLDAMSDFTFILQRGHGWRDENIRSRKEVREERYMGMIRAKQVSGMRWHLHFCMKSLPFDGFDSCFNNTAAQMMNEP